MLESVGGSVLSMPAFDFQGTNEFFSGDDAWREAPRRLAVFTSPRAVDFGLKSSSSEVFADTLIAAMGPATRDRLEQAGWQVDLIPEGEYNSESMLRLELLRKGGGEAVIFAAPGGRSALQLGLSELGWNVRLSLVYERIALDPDPQVIQALLDSDCLLSIWTSAAALDSLLGRLPQAVARKILASPMVVVSTRLARVAVNQGARRVTVSRGPDSKSIVDEVNRLAVA